MKKNYVNPKILQYNFSFLNSIMSDTSNKTDNFEFDVTKNGNYFGPGDEQD